MKRTLIADLHEAIDGAVYIQGWIDVRRDHGKLIFLDVRDRTGTVQCVALPQHQDVLSAAQTLRPEHTVTIGGRVNKRPDRMIKADQQNGDIELEITTLEILSRAHELPFDKDAEVNLDTLFDNRPLTLRGARGRDITRMAATIVDAYRRALMKRGFLEFQAPALVGGDAEGGAEVFRVEYFNDTPAYLATSPQLYKQIMVGAAERAFTIAKIFRAERSATSRHLAELTQMDFEMGFIHDHRDVMDMLEEVIRDTVSDVAQAHEDMFARFNSSAPLVPSKPFPRLSLRDAQELLATTYTIDARGEPDLEPEHERKLCEWAREVHASDFVFVEAFPTKKRAFYTYEDPDEAPFSRGFDLLFRGLEINSGAQRIHDYAALVARIVERGMDPERFSFYLQAFKYGMPPHGGCSTGLERFTARMLELPNVKEATPFPRDMSRIDTLL